MSDKERLEEIKESFYGADEKQLHHYEAEWLFQQAERVQELEFENRKFSKRFERQQKENARLREALEFYANKENYEMNETARKQQCLEIMWDRGINARRALEGESDA